MTPEAFREAGYQLIDRIAAYLDDPAAATPRIVPDIDPGHVRNLLDEHPPTKPESWSSVEADIDTIVMPNIANWQHPNWFAYFPANTSYASVLGDLLAAGLAQQGMSWASSPVCTELETLMMDWMVELLDLPTAFRSDGEGGGVIQGSASEGALVAILAARWRATNGRVNVDGDTSSLVAYVSDQAHSSIEKGLRIAGIGTDNIRLIGHDAAYAMDLDALAAAMERDRRAGLQPFFVCATRGTTSSMAMDDTAGIAALCRPYEIWLHVDGAMAGIAALAPEMRWIHDGLSHANSYSTNPHKWMGVGFDCSLWWTNDRAALLGALSILPEYLRSRANESGRSIDYRDWQIPLGRRFRALKLWFVLRLDGVDTIVDRLRRDVTVAAALGDRVASDDRFELAAPMCCNLVCFRVAGPDDVGTERLLQRILDTGSASVTRTVLDDRAVIRVCVGTPTASMESVMQWWDDVLALAAEEW